MISETTIQAVKNLNIEEVLSRFIPDLKMRNGKWTACCPMPDHNENTPSFTVNPAKGIFKCFGCGASGDAINFIQVTENATYPQAIEIIAKAFNVQIEHTDQKAVDPAVLDRHRTLVATMGNVADIFVQKMSDAVVQYLTERRFTQESIEKWSIGYAPGGGFLLALADRISTQEIFIEIGLTTEKGHEYFYQRIMFPIKNVKGEIIGFGARTTGKDVQPKYMNSKDSELYQKGNTLYGLFEAKDSIRKQGYAILVEGYTDVISMHQAGATNTIATCGTALTTEQCILLRKYTKSVLLLRDGDPAGKKATLRDIDILMKAGFIVNVYELQDGQDPDELAQEYYPLN
jgi:DNA primase